jgi:hypothetical protein
MAFDNSSRRLAAIGFVMAAVLGGAASGLFGTCGPFTDVAPDAFCPFVVEVFTLGITTGTTPTTYDPTGNVSRLQMAAFLSRSVDGALKRGGPRAALKQFWTTRATANIGLTTVGLNPVFPASDGADLWVPCSSDNTVSRVRGSDGKLLETWTGAPTARAALSATGWVFVAGYDTVGKLYRIDPSQPAGVVTTVANNLAQFPQAIAYDGTRIWTANSTGSVSIVTPGPTIPWAVANVTAGTSLGGIVYDGARIWVSDQTNGKLLKLDGNGAVLQTVTVGGQPQNPVFDGANIWVPSDGTQSVAVVRASNGAVLATLTGNGLSGPTGAAFDGQRVLVTNLSGNSISLWKAADLTEIGTLSTGAVTGPWGAASDGVGFFVTLFLTNRLARF